MKVEEIQALIEIFDNSQAAKLELEQGEFRLRLAKARPKTVKVASAPTTVEAAAVHPSEPTESASAAAPSAPSGPEMTSPIVGTFYEASNPDADPFATVGQRVKKGQVVCIIEAMKVMNEIESEYDGEIAEILVDNGQPVEFGEPLFRFKA